MTKVNMSNIRQELTNITNEVMFHNQRVIINKNNKPAFAIVPIADIQALEALEDKIDLEQALSSLKSDGSISLKDFKKKLGI
jgi:prevent-host-death family protein